MKQQLCLVRLSVCRGQTGSASPQVQTLAQRDFRHIQLLHQCAQHGVVDAVCMALGVQRFALHLDAVQAQLHFAHIAQAALVDS